MFAFSKNIHDICFRSTILKTTDADVFYRQSESLCEPFGAALYCIRAVWSSSARGLFYYLFYMLDQNKAGILLPPTGNDYPSHLIEATSHIRAAAHLIDQQLVALPDDLRQDREIGKELDSTRDDLWSLWSTCCERITLILTKVEL